MLQRSKTFAMLGLLAVGACAPAPPAGAGAAPAAAGVRNVIFMVADGGGVAYWSAAEIAAGDLAVEQMPVVGLVDTQSSSSRVTDSAAGATVYATGVRTYNGAIGVGPECGELLRRDSVAVRRDPSLCRPLESVFDIARRQGKATGVVTTTAVIDATPAAFAASAPLRYWHEVLVEQYAAPGLDVILGGGRALFDGSAPTVTRDRLSALCQRAACVSSGAELAAYRPDERPLVGLFAAQDLPRAGWRDPSLPQMVEAAIARLSRDPQGFVALFESEGTDEYGHENEPLAVITAEVLEFDRAVGEALEFARRDGRTLVIVTADHETGGLSLLPSGDSLVAAYTTQGHTAAMVPLFAFGPGAERFGGIHDNEEIGRMLKELVATSY